MSTYTVEFVRSAQKEFVSLPAKIQAKAVEALSMLSQNPYSDLLKIKKLKGVDELYRIRLGDYRLVYEVKKKRLVVIVIKIGNRRDIYR